MLSFLKKNIFVLVAMLVLLAGVAFYINSRKNDSDVPVVEATPQGGSATEDSDIVKKLTLLSTLSIKRDIFDSPAYRHLQPIRTNVPKPIFRNENPFAPIGQRQDRFGTSTAKTAATKTSTTTNTR
jgi:hypothetical protein